MTYKNKVIETAETPMALGGGGGGNPLEPKKEAKWCGSQAAKLECQKDLKFYNEQELNSPKVGWAYLRNSVRVELRRKSSRVDFSLPKIVKALPDKNKAAFTLAEVILVIGIIGIIAALTIPQLVQNAQNKELVSSFLKSNNVLANAYKEAKAVDNIQKMGVEDFKETFKKHVKTVECKDPHDICLQDGMFVDFTCNEEKCTELTVDTNGEKKPNKKGKDWFKFLITEDRIIPQGESEKCSGYDCGMYTLTYHKIFDGLIDNCKTYKEGKCETCDDGYHLSGNKCSQIKMDTCKRFTGEECSECNIGYLLQDSDCINMDSLNCATTEDGKTCSTCKSTHILNSTSKICESLDDLQCQTKAEDESCLECKTSYQNNNGVCETGAVVGCQTYSGLTCTSCSNQTILTNGTCQSLSSLGCQTKSSTTEQCTVCDGSHILSNNVCTDLGSLYCQIKSSMAEACSQCINTYQNNNGVCETGAVAGCQTYSGLTCTSCSNQTILTNGKCQSLAYFHCSVKASTEACQTCNSGYILTNNGCITNAAGNCAISSNGRTCDKCNDNYIGNGTSTCTSCGAGKYTKDHVTCLNNPSYCSSVTNEGLYCVTANGGVTLTKVGDFYVSPPTTYGVWGEDPNSVYPAAYDPANSCWVVGTGWFLSSDGYCRGADLQGGAKKYCQSLGLSLPSVSQLQQLRNSCSNSNKPYSCDDWFWTSNSYEYNAHYAYFYNMSTGAVETDYVHGGSHTFSKAICVSQ